MKWQPENTPVVVWAEGCFGLPGGKTATGVIRYGKWPVVAVIDSLLAGQTVQTVIKHSLCTAPVIASLQEALIYNPKVFMIGTAPPGGGLPENCRNAIIQAIKAGLDVISGLHIYLQEDPELVNLARQHHVTLWDVRQWAKTPVITRHLPRPKSKKVISFVGSDCAIGKMFSALECHRAAVQADFSSSFVATGQTGIMIDGRGIPLDSLIADFAAGIVEEEITNRYAEADWIWVEGQGSLLHPAYSGVTLSLLHGSWPDGLIFCHKAGESTVRNYTVPIPALTDLIQLYEQACSWARPAGHPLAKVLGIAVNTSALPEQQALAYLAQVEKDTGLPTVDPVRQGVERIWNNCLTTLNIK